MNVGRLSITELDELFMEAAETERKLPAAIRKQKMSSVTSWAQTGQSSLTKNWLTLVRASTVTQPAFYICSAQYCRLGIAPRQRDRPAALLAILCFVSDAKRLHLPDMLVLVISL